MFDDSLNAIHLSKEIMDIKIWPSYHEMIEQSIFRDMNCRDRIVEMTQARMRCSRRSAAEEEGDDLVQENTELTRIGITICNDGTKNFWVSMAPLLSLSSARLSPK